MTPTDLFLFMAAAAGGILLDGAALVLAFLFFLVVLNAGRSKPAP